MTEYIDVNVRLYLEADVNAVEAKEIIETMDYDFIHSLISDTNIFHYEINETDKEV